MSTFLTGVQDLATECGLKSYPTSVTSQVGEFARLVTWYKDAWIEIQNRTNWKWLRHEFTLNTVADDGIYSYSDCTDSETSSAITRFDSWRFTDQNDPPKIYLQSTGVGGERWLTYTPWDWFKSIYLIGSQTTNTGAPAHISVDPLYRIHIGPVPDAVYVITGDYYLSPQILSAGSDTPEMPTHFHKLIVYEAMKQYGYHEVAQEVLTRASINSKKMMRQLEKNQGPTWQIGGPLV